ncbi:TatD family hydrolase [Moheibacter sediminis]|uniref:TatD DNase family protein n=1 Tax=Moheibacter sediminis TaxID=1434700 RepID=A0A1W1YZS6_9FLAO|nr:TatD family hydrolase [Moheibacter sediminis]SMC41727.1 TatD DNase family protein [Moheibacter sediminis]
MLIDTHTHLYSDEFDNDRDEMIHRANSIGIERFYLPAIDSSYTQKMFDLEAKYPEQMNLMMGLHPTSVQPGTYLDELENVKNWLDKRAFSAVGEIGIDLYWDKTTLGIQQTAFKTQIGWAKEKGLPIVIHCRESFDEIFEILEEEKDEKLFGIFHCFTGTKEQAERAIGFNMKLGIGGVVTFKNGKIDQFLNEIPLEHIVLETDSPYLAPVPYRGKRNESAYLKNVVEKLVDIYQISEKEIAQLTSQNALSVFEN